MGEVPLQGLFTQRGYETLAMLYHVWSLPGDIQVLLDENNESQYNLFNLRYVVAPADRTFPDFVHLIGTFGRHRLYEVDTTGFFDLVDSSVNLVGTKTDFFNPATGWFRGSQLPAKEFPVRSLWGRPPERTAELHPGRW